MRYFLTAIILHTLLAFDAFAQDLMVPEYAAILSDYIQIPSEQYKEKPAGLFFMEECRKKGLYTEILTPEDSAFNFIASLYPLDSNKLNIVFLSHIDVVPPGDTTLWHYPPYSGFIHDSIIYGRGAIDDKGMGIAQLMAISEFVEMAKEKNLPFNVSILAVSGEETDGHTGAEQIAEKFLKRINPCLILGEGGSGVKSLIKSDPEKIVFGISTVEKSKIILNLEMEIKASGHGSVPPKEYAMKEIIFALEKILKKKPEIKYYKTSVKGLQTLGKHEKGIRGFVQRNFTFVFFKPFVKKQIENDPVLASFFANTITLTKLKIPEGTDNMISSTATAVFDCRLLPGVSSEKFIKEIDRLVKDPRVKIKVINEIIAAEQTENDKYFETLRNSILNEYPNSVVMDILSPVTTDNNYFRSKGIPVYGIFPSLFKIEELESVHSVNERIHFKSMEASIEVYKNLLDHLLTPEIPPCKPKNKMITKMQKLIKKDNCK